MPTTSTRDLVRRYQDALNASDFDALDDIIADTIRASEIIQRERRLLRKEQGKIESLDLNEVVREMETFIRADARHQIARAADEREYPAHPRAVRIDGR